MAAKSKVVGIVYALPPELIDRFEAGKTVFLKFVSHSPALLHEGSKLLLYSSGGSKSVVAEASIMKIEFLSAKEALSKYKARIFLTEKELMEYIKSQPKRDENKGMLVLHLDGFRKYATPTRFTRPMTMAGRYITKYHYVKLAVNKNTPT